ncbi:hypothetical protein ACGFYF_32535 [Streptomyces lavendulae]|uniref:hypothetical protein n=1 Tax=Streptomyces lavendulae TaxID=1914 RepID=UPI003713B4D1
MTPLDIVTYEEGIGQPPTASGDLLMDAPGYPQEWREFYVGHGAATEALRAAAPEALDWLVLSPAGDFDHEGEPSGGYALACCAARRWHTFGTRTRTS